MTLNVQGLAPMLQVFDMPASIHSYRDVLGFEVVTTSYPGERFDWALLRLNDATLMLNIAFEEGSDRLLQMPLAWPGTRTHGCSLGTRKSMEHTVSFAAKDLR